MKRCARWTDRRGPEAPAMSFYYRGADGQAHADTTWFGRKKRLENSFGIRWVEAMAAILHRHQRTAILATPRPDRQDPPAGHRSHGFDRVHNKVQHALLQLNLIARHKWDVIVQLQLQGDLPSLQFAPRDGEYFLHNNIDIQL